MMFKPALLRLVVSVVIGFHAVTLSAASLWFGDKDGLHRIDTASNHVVANVPFETAVAIGVNAADGSVWAVSQQRIAHLSDQGVVESALPLGNLGTGLGAPRLLALNPNDGSVWVALENGIVHVNAAGAAGATLPVSARDLAVAQDGSLWVLTDSALQHYDAAGAQLRSVALTSAQHFKDLALDDAGDALWLAGQKDLVQVRLSAPEQTRLSILAPETISGISADMQSGDLWAIGQNGLFSYGRDGQPRISRDLRDFSIANPQAILFDVASQAAWVGHQQGLTRVTVSGTMAAAFPASVQVGALAIGRTPLDVKPVVAIDAPVSGALLNTATPQLRVHYDALCGTVPCGFPNSFFGSFTLSASINGTESGSSFVFDPATGSASYTPSVRLPEGVNTFTAQARDSFGHLSETVTSSFTIDTVAPSFGAIAPAPGSTVSTASIAITGSVDDPAATVSLGGVTQGASFTFPVTLSEGANTFTLVARDAAGNTASLPLTYTYVRPNVPPSVAITSPAAGATFQAPASFTVTAAASDSDGTVVRVDFFLNGTPAGSDTVAPFTADLSALATGSYVLTAQATDDRGGVTTSAPVSVTVGPPNALPSVQLTASAGPVPVFAPATVQVTATASDSDGSVVRVEILRNGVVEATLTTAPYTATLTNVPAGTQSITARATDDRGGVTTSDPVSITVVAPSITITSPAPNTAFTDNVTLVRGTIVAPPYSGVQVNGQTAALDAAGNFAALVSLDPGLDTITATLVLFDGSVVEQSISVSSQGYLLPFSVEVTPATGYAPLATTFLISNPNNVNVSFTFDNYGPFFLGAGAAVQLNVTYQAGIATPTIVFRAGTSAFTYRTVIQAFDRTQTDQTLHNLWNSLNAALAAGDKATAMRYLTATAQERYGPVFDALMPYMPGIVASYSTLEPVSLSADIAEYAVTRVDGTTKRLYLIYFLRDAGGVWRVDGM